MDLVQKYQKHFVAITCFAFLVVIAGNVYAGECVVYDFGFNKKVAEVNYQKIEGSLHPEEEAIAGMIIGALIGVYVASVLLPLIANRTATLEANDDLDSNEQSLVGTWTLFIVLGVMGAIIGMAF